MYSVAADADAFYITSNEDSVMYDGDDLRFQFVFQSSKDARHFERTIDEIYKSVKESCKIETTLDECQLPTPLNLAVKARDYNPTSSSSPNISLHEAMSVSNSSVHSTSNLDSNPEIALLMIESPTFGFISQVPLCKCHLASVSSYPRLKDDVNNWLYLSWPMHQRFDEMHNRVPSIAIQYLSHEDDVTVNEQFVRSRVNLLIHFRPNDRETPTHILPSMKDGTQYDRTLNRFTSFVYVLDRDAFRNHLTIKYMETLAMWGEE